MNFPCKPVSYWKSANSSSAFSLATVKLYRVLNVFEPQFLLLKSERLARLGSRYYGFLNSILSKFLGDSIGATCLLRQILEN